jgi:hypothetical protein
VARKSREILEHLRAEIDKAWQAEQAL